MTYAIVETGGKQMRVEPGRFYDIELLAAEPGADYTLDRVLLVSHNDDVTVGQPVVANATVEGTILGHRRDRKVLVYKMRPKKKTRKKRGHRQSLTRFLVRAIHLDGQAIAEAEAAEIEALLAATVTDSEPLENANLDAIATAEPGSIVAAEAIAAAEPAAVAEAGEEPETEEPAAVAEADEEPETEEPAAVAEAGEEPAAVAEADEEPETEEPAAVAEADEEPETEEPAAVAEADEEPETEEPAAVAEAGEEPETEEPAAVAEAGEEPEAEEPEADDSEE